MAESSIPLNDLDEQIKLLCIGYNVIGTQQINIQFDKNSTRVKIECENFPDEISAGLAHGVQQLTQNQVILEITCAVKREKAWV